MVNRVALLVLALSAVAAAVRAQNIEWIHELDSQYFDAALGVSADGIGNVYFCGTTYYRFAGPSAGGYDVILGKADGAGNLLWKRQFGTNGDDVGRGISLDSAGYVYVSGQYGASAFISKYDSSGNSLWRRESLSTGFVSSTGVSADRLGNVFISGNSVSLGPYTVHGYVEKYDATGNLKWMRQFGTSNYDSTTGVASDGMGNMFVAGYTGGSIGGPNAGAFDGYVSKYDSAGNLVWSRQIGQNKYDYARSISADQVGNVFIAGDTQGSLDGPNAGYADAYVCKYDGSGNLLWLRQLGTNSNEIGTGVSVDALGNVYLLGLTGGTFPGNSDNSGQVFLSKFSATGDLLWVKQFGPLSYDGQSVATDNMGHAYVTGGTGSVTSGNDATNVFIAKIGDVPEPESILLIIFAATVMLQHRRRVALAPPVQFDESSRRYQSIQVHNSLLSITASQSNWRVTSQ